jgi:hypothetical protein
LDCASSTHTHTEINDDGIIQQEMLENSRFLLPAAAGNCDDTTPGGYIRGGISNDILQSSNTGRQKKHVDLVSSVEI